MGHIESTPDDEGNCFTGCVRRKTGGELKQLGGNRPKHHPSSPNHNYRPHPQSSKAHPHCLITPKLR